MKTLFQYCIDSIDPWLRIFFIACILTCVLYFAFDLRTFLEFIRDEFIYVFLISANLVVWYTVYKRHWSYKLFSDMLHKLDIRLSEQGIEKYKKSTNSYLNILLIECAEGFTSILLAYMLILFFNFEAVFLTDLKTCNDQVILFCYGVALMSCLLIPYYIVTDGIIGSIKLKSEFRKIIEDYALDDQDNT